MRAEEGGDKTSLHIFEILPGDKCQVETRELQGMAKGNFKVPFKESLVD